MSTSFNLVPGRLNINAVSGDDFAVLLQFKDADGVAINLSSYSFQARILLDNAPSNRYQIITVTNTNLTEGRITLSLSDAQTQALGALSNRKWFITWSQGPETRTFLSGTFTLNQKWGVTDYSPTTENQTIVIETPTISIEVIGGVGGAVLWGDIQGDIEDQTDLIDYISSSLNPYYSIGYNQAFVFEGDSITAGDEVSPGEDYPSQCMSMDAFNGRGVKYNVATSGATLASITSDYISQVYPLRPSELDVSKSILMVLIGANDLESMSPDSYILSLEDYCLTAKSDGFEVWLYTILPQRNLTANGGANLFRINNLIRKSLVPDFILDAYACLPNPLDLAYFQNGGVHLTYIGYNRLAQSINCGIISNGISKPQSAQTMGSRLIIPVAGQGLAIQSEFYQLSPDTNSGLEIQTNFNQPANSTSRICGVRSKLFKGSNFSTSYSASSIIAFYADLLLSGGSVDGFQSFFSRPVLYGNTAATIGAHYYSTSPIVLETGSVNQMAGVWIEPQKVEGVNFGYGIVQIGSNDSNYFEGTFNGPNLSGTNTGDQYGSATASAANQYLRRNAANSAYEFAPKTEYLTIVPTNGQAIAFNDNPNDQVFYINPAGDLADLQLILPSNSSSVNGQKAVYCITKNIATLAFTGATTIFNAPVSANAGDCLQFYKMASNVWARVIT